MHAGVECVSASCTQRGKDIPFTTGSASNMSATSTLVFGCLTEAFAWVSRSGACLGHGALEARRQKLALAELPKSVNGFDDVVRTWPELTLDGVPALQHQDRREASRAFAFEDGENPRLVVH